MRCKKTTLDVSIKRQGSLGPSWKLATTEVFPLLGQCNTTQWWKTSTYCACEFGGQKFRQGTEGLACLCYPMSRAERLKVLLSPGSLCSLHKRPINPRDEVLRRGIQLDFFNNIFYLFMAVLSLPCCTGFSLLWPVGVTPQSQYTGFSCCRAQGL